MTFHPGESRNGARRTVLVIAHLPFVRELWSAHLRHSGHVVLAAESSRVALDMVSQVLPDGVLIDVEGPNAQETKRLLVLCESPGLSSLPQVRLNSAPSSTGDVHGSAKGARLRVGKPYSVGSVFPRVHELLGGVCTAEVPAESDGVLRYGPLVLDVRRHRLLPCQGEPKAHITLTQTEFRLVQLFITQAEVVHDRLAILRAVWGSDMNDERSVDQAVKRLRRSLDQLGQGDMLQTVRGAGYRLSVELPAALNLSADRAALQIDDRALTLS